MLKFKPFATHSNHSRLGEWYPMVPVSLKSVGFYLVVIQKLSLAFHDVLVKYAFLFTSREMFFLIFPSYEAWT